MRPSPAHNQHRAHVESCNLLVTSALPGGGMDPVSASMGYGGGGSRGSGGSIGGGESRCRPSSYSQWTGIGAAVLSGRPMLSRSVKCLGNM